LYNDHENTGQQPYGYGPCSPANSQIFHRRAKVEQYRLIFIWKWLLIFRSLMERYPPHLLTKTTFMERKQDTTDRRSFLGSIATGAVAMSMAGLAAPLQSIAKQADPGYYADDDPDAWFNKIKGKHRIVFDATRPHEIMPFVWPAVFQMTNQATGTPPSDTGVVVVLRHSAIPYAFQDNVWAKYNFVKVFDAGDIGPAFKAADYQTALNNRNPFWKPKKGDFQVPGFGAVPIGINELQEQGVMFCVCNAAMTVYSNAVAQQTNMKAEQVYNDWKAALIPGIQIVPSGVWAVGRAQEHGCAYCFAG
jgi:hypothetical protein